MSSSDLQEKTSQKLLLPDGIKPYYQDDSVCIIHGDCRDILPLLDPVDLVLTDPPYGIGESNEKNATRGKLAAATDYGAYNWDKNPIDQSLFDMMISAGEFACVWGGNYYLTAPSSCWLIWDKENGANDFADAEMAWTNWPKAVRLKRHRWNGMLRLGNEARFHPTQKPLQVMSWAIGLSPKADTILDPFMGSGTTLRAAKDLGRKAIGIELEERYCEIAARRMAQEVLL